MARRGVLWGAGGALFVAAVAVACMVTYAGIEQSPTFAVGTAAAVLLTVVLVTPPATHALAVGENGYSIFQPFQGRPLFVVLQALAWMAYAVVLLIAIVFVLTRLDALPPRAETPNVLIMAGAVGFLAQVALTTSLLVFHGGKGAAETELEEKGQKKGKKAEKEEEEEKKEGAPSDLVERAAASGAAAHAGGSWQTVAVGLLLLAFLPATFLLLADSFASVVDVAQWRAGLLAVAALFVATPLTYAVVGRGLVPDRLRAAAGTATDVASALVGGAPPGSGANRQASASVSRRTSEFTFRLWQPFKGGPAFIALQAVAWIAYSVAVCLSFVYVYDVSASGGGRPRPNLVVVIAASGALSQAAVFLSLYAYQLPSVGLHRRRTVRRIMRRRRRRRQNQREHRTRLRLRSEPGGASSGGDDGDRSSGGDTLLSAGSEVDGSDDGSSLEAPDDFTSHEPLLEWNSVGVVTLLLAVGALLLFEWLEFESASDPAVLAPASVSDFSFRLQIGLAGTTGLIIAAPLTHGVVGRLRHRHLPQGFQFYQPLRGGLAFVVLQALGWICYSAFLVIALGLGYTFLVRGVVPIQGMISAAGIAGVAAEVFVLVSLAYYKASQRQRRLSRARADLAAEAVGIVAVAKDALLEVFAFLVVATLYQIPVLCFAVAGVICWLLGPFWPIGVAIYFGHFVFGGPNVVIWLLCALGLFFHTPALVLLVVVTVLYSLTWRNAPHTTGALRSDLVRGSVWVWDAVARYFSFRLCGVRGLDPEATYVFGFHPHGIIPGTCIWLGLNSAWLDRHPGVAFDTVSASVIFRAPLLRDATMACGTRDATKGSISNALSSNRSIMLVPGGQAEMREWTPETDRMVLITRHKGFVRMALKHGAALVPVISFQEEQILYNIQAKPMQEWTCRKIGFGLPHLPYGRWYSQVPNATPVVVAVGAPLPVPHVPEPDEALVNKYHRMYYDRVREAFEAHKAEAGAPNCELIFKDR